MFSEILAHRVTSARGKAAKTCTKNAQSEPKTTYRPKTCPFLTLFVPFGSSGEKKPRRQETPQAEKQTHRETTHRGRDPMKG
jgi:hypothetical protein